MPRHSKPPIDPKSGVAETEAPSSRGVAVPPGGAFVFQHPGSKDFFAWNGPTVKELVAEKAHDVVAAEAEKYKAITIRPTVQDVELLDELATLFRQSRNETACALLGAALREALHSLPDHIRERVQMAAFKRLEWGIVTPSGQVVLPDSMFKDGKLIGPDQTASGGARHGDERSTGEKPDGEGT
jgi:hypothetical protein